jgi:hypothetical protein
MFEAAAIVEGAAIDPSANATAELLDRICTLDLKRRGAVAHLYAEARRQVSQPLTLRAADALRRNVKSGDVVVLCTGFPVRPWIDSGIGETDGPPGAAALARALSLGFGAVPVVTAPPLMVPQVRAALVSGGVLPLPLDQARQAAAGSRPTCAGVVVPFPTDSALAPDAAAGLIALRPAAILAVEHPGANAKGIYHSSLGIDISEGCAKVEGLFEAARSRQVLTLSCLDMPNEIGAATLKSIVPNIAFGGPQGAAAAGASEVDIVVVGATVNWAAYAVAAMLSVLLDKSELCATVDRDHRMLAAVQAHGGVEGVTGSIEPGAGVDGVSAAESGLIVELIRSVAGDAQSAARRTAF